MTKERQWFQTSDIIQVRRRSEEVCFAEDHFKCLKETAAEAAGYEFSSAS